MKFVTRILALILVGVMALTLAACHQKDEVVMTVGETSIPAGLYLGFQLEAYQTLMSGVQEQLSASSDAPTINKFADYFNYDYEGQSAADYIRTQAEKSAVEYAVVQKLCAEYELELSKDQMDYLDSYAAYYWTNLEPYYTANGVSLETYKEINRFNSLRSLLFDYYYNEPNEETGKGGVEQVADKDLLSALTKDYLLADFISVATTPADSSAAAITDEQIAAMKEKYDGYAKRFNSGEATFAELYKEDTGSELQLTENTVTGTDADPADSSIYPSSAKVLSANDSDTTQYDLFAAKMKADGFAYGKAYVLGGKDAGAYYLAVFYDLSKDAYYLKQYRSTLLHDLKDDTFTEKLAAEGAKLTLVKNDGLMNYYKPTNINFDKVASAK